VKRKSPVNKILCSIVLLFQITACLPIPGVEKPLDSSGQPVEPASLHTPTPLPTREKFQPGQLVEYVAQPGDTLPGLASHFNTTIAEIREANPIIPKDASTMPAGFPMKMPIYYQELWGSPYQIIPDSLFVYGPAQKDFDTVAFVNKQSGWFKNYTAYASDENRNGGEIVDLLARNYSISPRLLLAIIEFQTGGLTSPALPSNIDEYPLGYKDFNHKGLYLQLSWAANTLNNGYYDWRSGILKIFEHSDGKLERPDPWQNAGTVALQFYLSRKLPQEVYSRGIGPDGIAAVYTKLFGNPWESDTNFIPGSLKQPPLRMPFLGGKFWSFTGGPHSPWGDGSPRAALDFAPPAVVGGCAETYETATAVADGIVVRADPAIAVLDLDGDGDERTGWVIFYLHLASSDKAKAGTRLKAGDPIGRPSCEGGRSTGTHVHLARKYNGEWIPADGPIPFDFEGWLAKDGSEPYLGSLTKYSRTIYACVCSDAASQVQSEVY
jgi:LasA protease